MPRPRLSRVLETVLYFTEETRTEQFYRELLGMRLLAREPGRSLFFRAGESVFLLFRAEDTASGGKLPAHGASGPVHTCFEVPAADYDPWRTYLADAGVALIHEAQWADGRSFYFRDPDGNLLEIADSDLWPR